MRSQGISQFYLHTQRLSAIRNERYLPLPSQPFFFSKKSTQSTTGGMAPCPPPLATPLDDDDGVNCQLIVNLMDMNDNVPMFPLSQYIVQGIAETVAVGTDIIQGQSRSNTTMSQSRIIFRLFTY